MSELIEQLVNEIEETVAHDISQIAYSLTVEQLEAFAKAYQAAAPIDKVAEALEKAAKLCEENPRLFNTGATLHLMADKIRALIPDTQANRTEG
jgi:hypothetical protein